MMNDTQPRGAWALDYAECGWAVFPLYTIRDGHCTCPGWKTCGSPGKHPLTGHGVKDATTDVSQIRAWWKATPHANIAIATGSRSGVLVVDADVHSGGMDRLGDFALTETRKVRTGSGGLHLYYLCSKTTKGQENLTTGIHAKGDGGYVVAPPSVHVRGVYQWLNPEAEIAEVPLWLLNWRPAQPNGTAKREGWVEELLTDTCPDGQRNETLTRLAGYFRNVLPEGVTLAVLAEWNEHHCSPPLSEFEVQQNVKHKYRIYAAPPPREPKPRGLDISALAESANLGILYHRVNGRLEVGQ